MTILTIGYEGAKHQDFLETLKSAGVNMLIDVRDFAGSRRKGFAKTALRQSVNDIGINYQHFKALGDPKEGRDAARAGDFSAFRRIFNDHLSTEQAQKALIDVANLAKTYSICLMCYEREPQQCHRSIVAIELASILSCDINHIGVVEGAGAIGIAAE